MKTPLLSTSTLAHRIFLNIGGIFSLLSNQRAALLTTRWSGARREEIGRLSLECLDRYPDGTARLHLPAGKTKRERIVPLNEEATVVIQEVQALRKQLAVERGFPERLTRIETHYLFVRHGKLLSVE